MRWEYKPKTIFGKIKKRFAFFPVIVKDEWFWLETYYSYSEEHYAGVAVIRFKSYQDAFDWCSEYEYGNRDN